MCRNNDSNTSWNMALWVNFIVKCISINNHSLFYDIDICYIFCFRQIVFVQNLYPSKYTHISFWLVCFWLENQMTLFAGFLSLLNTSHSKVPNKTSHFILYFPCYTSLFPVAKNKFLHKYCTYVFIFWKSVAVLPHDININPMQYNLTSQSCKCIFFVRNAHSAHGWADSWDNYRMLFQNSMK